MPAIQTKPGFRLKTGITDHQRAKLSWLTANAEPNRQSSTIASNAGSFRLITQQTQVPSISDTANYYHNYYDRLPFDPTRPPSYYIPNFRTIPPTYYNGYLPPLTYVQPTHLPISTMIATIRNILSLLQKTMYPNSTSGSTDFNTTRNIPEEANFTNSNEQLSRSTSVLSSSSSLSSSLLSSLLSSSSSTAGGGGEGREKVEEIGVTMISGNDGDIENGQLLNVVEEVKGSGIRKVTLDWMTDRKIEGVTKVVHGKFHEINKIETISTTTAAVTTTTSAVDDGSNLLGSLLKGRLDKVDWFGSLFGYELPTKEEGSAVAQIFKGGIFGPAN
uniref:Uncharacterized protein n=1 Tax=Elaeophora elaphi TaxID=1147741 RepID=A0A0R3RNQ8_9BILA